MLLMAHQDVAASFPSPSGSVPAMKDSATGAFKDGANGRIIFWEEEGRSIKSIINEEGFRKAGHLFLIVGPEGGFSREEIESAQNMGFVVASLGAQVLRVETASLVVLAILQYELGIFSGVENLE
jgi:16S rRNA (uracil1498-N3)-methyltransferase